MRNSVAFGLMLLLASCSGLGSDEGASSDKSGESQVQRVTSDGVASNTNNFSISGLFTFNIPSGADSVTVVSNGGSSESDADISYLQGPDGTVYITEVWNDIDPIGRNAAQVLGKSTQAFTVPHADYARTMSGDWFFKFGCEVCSSTTNSVLYKGGETTSFKVNIILVSQSDITPSSASLQTVINEFKRVYAVNGLSVSEINYYTYSSADAFINDDDFNGNGQFDGMDRLFETATALLPESQQSRYINVFFISELGEGILGISGGIPGPYMAGTPHSGVVVSTFNGLAAQSAAFLSMTGQTMAHEIAHFLGLFHPTERSGTLFDPISDTGECPSSYDVNSDGQVSPSECPSSQGLNNMFWTADGSNQDQFTSGQEYVMRRSAFGH